MKRKSGIKGVVWCSRYKKWIAQYQPNKKHYWGGYHKTIKEAAKAREKLVEEYGPVYEPIVLKIKKHTTRSVCRIMRCTDKCEGRGLCKKHYRLCSYNDLLDTYGVPPYRGEHFSYKINKKAGPYVCRMIVDGENCQDKIYIRGLCKKHYNKCHREDRVEEFALPAYVNGKRAIGVRDYDYSKNKTSVD